MMPRIPYWCLSVKEEHRQQDEDLMQLDAADSMDCGDAGAHAAAVIGPGPVQASGTATPQPKALDGCEGFMLSRAPLA